MKRALITGLTGQDGRYLAELLLGKGYEVHGLVRRTSATHAGIVGEDDAALAGVTIHHGDLTDGTGLARIVGDVDPDEVYNLAAQSDVRISFDQPEYTADVTGTGALRLFEAVRNHRERSGRDVRVYQASSSEMFGSASPPQSEATPFQPRSPYAVAKCAAHGWAINYRESYGMFTACGILFNHESPRRGPNFVTRKVTRAAARIKVGLQERLSMGNLEAKRDWGYAGDFVRAMWMMLQADAPDDYVIATGEAHSVRELLAAAFGGLGMDWEQYVDVDPALFRPAEVDYLLGDATKAREALGWEPETRFEALIKMMADRDLADAEREAASR